MIDLDDKFVVYSWGLVYASVCTTLNLEAATERLNKELPTGVHPWEWASQETFATGEPNPHECESSDAMHYLFNC